MPSWNLKRTGPVARYLGFIVGEPTYCPRSFCSLFWMLLFSPLIFVFCRIIAVWCYFRDKIDSAIQKSRERQAADLTMMYHKDTSLAVRDYYEHMSRARWDISARDRARPEWLVAEAFQLLRTQFDVQYNLEVLVKLGAIKNEDENEVWILIGKWETAVPSTRRQLREALSDYAMPVIVMGGTTLVMLPLVIMEPAGAFVISSAWIITIAAVTVYRLEAHVVVYNVYKAIKDRTCPLINWV